MEGEVLYTHLILVPHDSDGIGPGNTVNVVTCLYDADLQGSSLTVQSVGADSYNTRRELKCLLSQGGGDLG